MPTYSPTVTVVHPSQLVSGSFVAFGDDRRGVVMMLPIAQIPGAQRQTCIFDLASGEVAVVDENAYPTICAIANDFRVEVDALSSVKNGLDSSTGGEIAYQYNCNVPLLVCRPNAAGGRSSFSFDGRREPLTSQYAFVFANWKLTIPDDLNGRHTIYEHMRHVAG